MYNRFPSLISNTGSAAFDADAQSFINAAGITNNTQKNAINQLVLDYKSYGIWSKMVAIYPLVGGTSTTHSYNLKNTSQYQIVWYGTITHNSNGVTGDGSTGYGNTGIVPSTALILENVHISFYRRTGNNTDSCAIGAATNGNGLSLRTFAATPQYAQLNSSNYHSYVPTNFLGSFVATKDSSNYATIWRNALGSGSGNTTTSLPSDSIFVLANNNWGGVASFCNDNFSMFTIGQGLTSTNVSNKYTADQAFQTTLGRNV